MKVIYAFLFSAAVVALTQAAPADNNTDVVDWTAVRQKVDEIEAAIHQGGEAVIYAASSENEQIGSTIADKVKSTGSSIDLILQQIIAAINNQTLTDTQAQELIGQIRGNIARLLGSIRSETAQLSPGAEAVIDGIFKATFDSVEAKALELSALLLA